MQEPKAIEQAAKRTRKSSAPPQVESALLDFDTQLMLQVGQGDEQAAGMLVRRNFERVSRYMSRLVRNATLVEDLTQDVFLSVLAHAAEYEPRAKFTTWLYRIATNRALSHMRQASVRRQFGEAYGSTRADEHEDAELTPDRKADVDELRRRVCEALGALPIKQRVALTLFEYENLSYEQISAVVDVTVEAVRSLLTRARAALRRDLAGLL